MRSVRKLVYYCEFKVLPYGPKCKVYKLTPQSMEVHEKHCTLNPNRVCRTAACNVKGYWGLCPWCHLAEARQKNWAGWDWERDIRKEYSEWNARLDQYA